MDKQTRIKVAEAINTRLGGGLSFTEKDVKKLKRINTFSPGGPKEHYHIYALQMGDLTIMCWVRSDGSIVVKGQAW